MPGWRRPTQTWQGSSPLGRKFSVLDASSGRYKELPLKRLPATAGCVGSVHLVRPIFRDFRSQDLPGVRSQRLQCLRRRGAACGGRNAREVPGAWA